MARNLQVGLAKHMLLCLFKFMFHEFKFARGSLIARCVSCGTRDLRWSQFECFWVRNRQRLIALNCCLVHWIVISVVVHCCQCLPCLCACLRGCFVLVVDCCVFAGGLLLAFCIG